ncbi:MAG: hypothetical protein V4671_00985 [Armatimonadota bacterium]
MKVTAACTAAGATLAPIALFSAYLFVEHRLPTEHFPLLALLFDYFAWVALSVGAGVYFLLRNSLSVPARVLSLLLYIPGMGSLLFFYGFWFAGVAFGEWI